MNKDYQQLIILRRIVRNTDMTKVDALLDVAERAKKQDFSEFEIVSIDAYKIKLNKDGEEVRDYGDGADY